MFKELINKLKGKKQKLENYTTYVEQEENNEKDNIIVSEENGICKIDILDYLLNCGANFIALGGHPGAAGMSMTKTEFDIAKEFQIPKPPNKNQSIFTLIPHFLQIK